MPLNKYASHVTHIFPTALLLYAIYRSHITANTRLINKKHELVITMLFPYMCQQQEASPMPHKPINSCPDIRQLHHYMCLIRTHHNQQCDHKHWYTYFSHYWHRSLNKYVSHIVHVCSSALLLQSTYRPYITFHISENKNNKPQFLLTIILSCMCHQQICPSNATHCNYFMCTYGTAMST